MLFSRSILLSRIYFKPPRESPNPFILQKRLPNQFKPKPEKPAPSTSESPESPIRTPRVLVSLRRCLPADSTTFQRLLDQAAKSLGELTPQHVAETLALAISASQPVPDALPRSLSRRHDLLSLATVLATPGVSQTLSPEISAQFTHRLHEHLMDERVVDDLAFPGLVRLILAIDRFPGSITDLTKRQLVSRLNRVTGVAASWDLLPLVPSLGRLNLPGVDWRPIDRALQGAIVSRLELDLGLVGEIGQTLIKRKHVLAHKWSLFEEFIRT